MSVVDFALIRKSLRVSSYDANRYVLDKGNGKYYLISQKTHHLINGLKAAGSWEEAHRNFGKQEQVELSLDEFIGFVYKLLHIDAEEESGRRHSYLRLRLTVIPEKPAGILGEKLGFLFIKKSFFWLFGALALVNVAFFLFTTTGIPAESGGWTYLTVFLLFSFSIVLHETGHIAACRTFGARHGGMGVGFYFIFPVFWADVSGLWMLPRRERIITNLAGIHAQLFTNVILMILYLLIRQPVLLLAIDAIVLGTLFQLWPFMRYDGYWILSDILQTPNMLKTSWRHLKSLFLGWIGVGMSEKRDARTWSLVIYAFFNALLTIFYLLFVLVRYDEIVVHYPDVTGRLVWGLLKEQKMDISLLINYLIVTLFYYILIKKLFTIAGHYFRRQGWSLFRLHPFNT